MLIIYKIVFFRYLHVLNQLMKTTKQKRGGNGFVSVGEWSPDFQRDSSLVELENGCYQHMIPFFYHKEAVLSVDDDMLRRRSATVGEAGVASINNPRKA